MTYHANPGPSLKPGQPARFIEPHYWWPRTPEEIAAATERLKAGIARMKAESDWRDEAIALRDELDPAPPRIVERAKAGAMLRRVG